MEKRVDAEKILTSLDEVKQWVSTTPKAADVGGAELDEAIELLDQWKGSGSNPNACYFIQMSQSTTTKIWRATLYRGPVTVREYGETPLLAAKMAIGAWGRNVLPSEKDRCTVYGLIDEGDKVFLHPYKEGQLLLFDSVDSALAYKKRKNWYAWDVVPVHLSAEAGRLMKG